MRVGDDFMKRFSSKPMSLEMICSEKLNLRPAFQRYLVWQKENQQSLIDSVLRNHYIPELVFCKSQDPAYKYIVIDGQQRIDTIRRFMSSRLRIARDTIIDGIDLSNLFYREIPVPIRERIESYTISFVLIEGTQNEISNMFHKLQSGLPLNKAEKRHGSINAVQETVHGLVNHSFITEVVGVTLKSNRRMKWYELIEQLLLLESYMSQNTFGNIKDTDIAQMYADYSNEIPMIVTDKLKGVLDFLYDSFLGLGKKNYLKKMNIHVLYLLVSKIMSENLDYNLDVGLPQRFGKWFIEFEQFRQVDSLNTVDEQSSYVRTYNSFMSGTASAASLQGRLDVLWESWNYWNKANSEPESIGQ